MRAHRGVSIPQDAPAGAVSGAMDGTVRLWDLLSGVCLHKLEEHKGKPRVSAAVVVVTALCSPH